MPVIFWAYPVTVPKSRNNENKKHLHAIRFIVPKLGNGFLLKNVPVSKSLLILSVQLSMRSAFFTALILISATVLSQVSPGEISLLEKLDSVSKSGSPAKHFARLYITATTNAIYFWQTRTEEEKQLNRRFETRFTSYFFSAADSFNNRKKIPDEWSSYFHTSDTSLLQYQLLGINAHINGDIWKALTAEFSSNELKLYKKSFLTFNKLLNKQYFNLYEESLLRNNHMRLLHQITYGLDRWYCSKMLLKWRKRQMKLAELYNSNPAMFLRKEKSLRKKKLRLDKVIVNIF